jgi:hypothetical protein
MKRHKSSLSWQTCAVGDAAPWGAIGKPLDQERQETWWTCAVVAESSWKDQYKDLNLVVTEQGPVKERQVLKMKLGAQQKEEN